ncbi:MAG: sulfatase-like hydrolase/transferase [Agathobacter sp.]|nr:sulfatase-like hydrolase/transferase [Agathobacter sp.]
MIGILGYILATLLWLEAVYHIAIFGLNGIQPLLLFAFAVLVAGVELIFVRVTKKRGINLGFLWGIQVVNFLLFAVQLVYYNVFTRPLMLEVALVTGGDALTDFAGVAIDGIINSLVPILFMAVPLVLMAFLLKKKILLLDQNSKKEWIGNVGVIAGGLLAICLLLVGAYHSEDEFYGEFQEFYAPDEIAKDHGVLTLYARQMMFDLLPEKATEVWQGGIPVVEESESVENSGAEMGAEENTEPEGPVIDTSPNVLNIDFDALKANGDGNIDWLADIMQSMTPSKKNEYTGMMEGYNLIYITAEAFSPYAVSEELTPTLYKMLNSGVVVKDYYIPLWNTSTSDGEYVNLMGQIPDGTHSFRRTKYNSYPYALPKYFAAEGANCYAYHNNSLSYYDRYITHPNLGFDFKAALRGSLSAEEWGHKIFPMNDPKAWPSSDYDMMVGTVPEWINDERFFAYYMTLSGHTNYTWAGNQMARKNQALVAHLPYSEQMKAYIACNYEVERALTYLVEQLTIAGKLDTTLIVLSADHHPYGMKDVKNEMEAFNGTSMTNLDVQRNCLVMWNSQMEPVYVEKTCSAMDILPTIMNLFGFEYDSRLFAGRDMLSDSPSLVVFSNRSFITDSVIYDAPTNAVTRRTDVEVSGEYIEAMKAYVKTMFQYSAGILNHGFDAAVGEAQIEEPEIQLGKPIILKPNEEVDVYE